MQTFYPVFESGQVLTNAHLNQLFQYLNEQQLASRRKLIGIGVMCGLQANVQENQVLVSKGIALSSAGHLMCQPNDKVYTQFRAYKLPVSQAVEDDSDIDAITAEKLLPIEDLPMWELLGSAAEEDEADPLTELTAAFVQDKVVMLLLEAKQESLKNCDANNCADKGARMQFTLRTLLINDADAERLWQFETSQQKELFPRDLNWQGLEKLLQPAVMGKLICSATKAESLEEIYAEVDQLVNNGWLSLKNQLQGSFDVYSYLLRDYFPQEQFPTDPWDGIETKLAMPLQSVEDLMVNIHHYDVLIDAISSYNEFLDKAREYEALCCPYEMRFPYHVLLGKADPKAQASQATDGSPLSFNFGLGAQAGYPYLRHCFYPNPQFKAETQCARQLADLYYRTWLIFKRYHLDGLLAKNIEISPSQLQGPLSQKALPYYLAIGRNDDLHRNWNPDKTVKGALGRVYGYHINTSNPHPLAQMPQRDDFYRIEGLMGKPLGQTIAELQLQKNQLGLSFAIEPVFLPLKPFGNEFDKQSVLQLLTRNQILMRLFKCKVGDLDMIFLILIAVLFQLIVGIIYLLARLKSPDTAGATPGRTFSRRFVADTRAMNEMMVELDIAAFNELSRLTVSADRFGQSSEDTTFIRKQLKQGNLITDDVLKILDETDDPNGKIAEIYVKTKAVDSGDLFEKVVTVVGRDADKDETEEVYQSARMMQESEKLMGQLSVDSVVQFDFDAFNSSMHEINDAHVKLMRVSTDRQGTDQAVVKNVNAQMGMLATLGDSAVLANIQQEFGQRLKNIFAEFLFDGFVNKHPDTEHLCGVPKGGTLILAYTHKALMQKYVPPGTQAEAGAVNLAAVTGNADVLREAGHRESISNAAFTNRASSLMSNLNRSDTRRETAFATTIAAGRSDRNTLNVRNVNVEAASVSSDRNVSDDRLASAIAELGVSAAVQPEDPLNDMVVLMDFCIPTFCCDSDCADLELEFKAPPVDSRPVTISIEGRIVEQVTGSNFLSNERLTTGIRTTTKTISHATLTVEDRNGKNVAVTMARGTFLFKVKTGEYTVIAAAKGYQLRKETMTFTQSQSDVLISLLPDRDG